MKVTLYKSTLEEVMKVANRTIGNAAQSITSHVLFTAAGNMLTAMSTDLTAATRIAATAQVAEAGSICLPAKTLAEIVKKLPGWSGDVTISTNEKTWTATLTFKAYRGNIKGLNPGDMPIMPTMEDLQNLEGSTVILARHARPRQGHQAGRHVRPGQEHQRHQAWRRLRDVRRQHGHDDSLRRQPHVRAHHPHHRHAAA